MRPYYEEAGIVIYHGDCREFLPHFPAPEIIITDPPYGVALKRGDGRNNDRVTGDDAKFDPRHLLNLGAATVLFGANAYAEQLPASNGWLVWDKYHHEKSQHSQCELAWTNFVGGIRIYREAYHGFMRKSDGWLHPTQKPVGLMQWVLNLHWMPKIGLVCDPYMGSGPVLVACKNLNRGAIGIEIEEKYCEIAAERLSQNVLDFGVPA